MFGEIKFCAVAAFDLMNVQQNVSRPRETWGRSNHLVTIRKVVKAAKVKKVYENKEIHPPLGESVLKLVMGGRCITMSNTR